MRVLILSAAVGSGHMRAAEAVASAVVSAGGEARVVDVLGLASSAFRRLYGDGYLALADRAPRLLGYLYDALDRAPGPLPAAERLRVFVQRWSVTGLPAVLSEPWDAVVCTHFLPAEIVACLRRQGRFGAPLAIAITDFDAHRLWVHEPCERYFASSPLSAATLGRWGVPEERVSVTGIPVHPAFARPPQRAQARRAGGFLGSRPVVLQMAGGSGTGPVEETFAALLAARTPIELVAVTGRNKAARLALLSKLVPSRHRVQILGYTDRVHELMAAADVLVSKPGGLTSSEALACGLPLIAVSPIPGQESRNCAYLVGQGAALQVDALPRLPAALDALLAGEGRLDDLRGAARSLARPRAAEEIAAWALSGSLVPARA